MSGTSMSREFDLVFRHHGFSFDDLHAVTRNAVAAAFCDEATRREVLERVEAGYRTR